jgi:hypothetical protein
MRLQSLTNTGEVLGQCGRRIQAGSLFLRVRWLDTDLDLPNDAPSPHPKLRQAGALHDTLIATKRLWVTAELGLSPTFRAFA